MEGYHMDRYAKAIVSGLSAGLVMYFTLRDGGMTAGEWEAVATSTLAGLGLTWAVPNTTERKPTDAV